MSLIPASAADLNEAEHAFTFLGRPESVRLIREMADVVLRSWALERLVPDIKLIVSELATNAVAETPGEEIALLIKHEGTSVTVGVWDPSPRPPEERACDLEAESGRGLLLVARTADTHGWHIAQDRERRTGKIVWARIAL